VALSSALNWKRSKTRYRRKIDQFADLVATTNVAGGSPQDEARLNWLYDRIRELPPIDRSLILLSLDRVSYGEIATITGLSESHVGVRLHRIREQLKKQSEEVKDEV
jgi:RNA polymerase sigma-70 factor (ECF subfamily)